MFTKIDKNQLNEKIQFIDRFMGSSTPADGSSVDANANVSSKNIATMHAEVNKDINVQINRELNKRYLEKIFHPYVAIEYIRQINSHEIYVHDESNICLPYCVAISLYPFLQNGLTGLGGESKAPKHLASFCGSFVNLIFALSSQFAGAVAVAEFLMAFDYFAKKEHGENYLETHSKVIDNHLQHIIYALNQPAAARNYQSVFFNISIFDKYFFNGLFEHFVFPDGTRPDYESLSKLQKYFMKWFSKEREKAILTFPVVTAAMLVDKEKPLDEDFGDFVCGELAEGNSFFVYTSDSVDSLSSCCRLRNAVENANEFSYTLGAVGVMTGSVHVITMNMNRFIQNAYFTFRKNPEVSDNSRKSPEFIHYLHCLLNKEIKKIHMYHAAFREILKDYKEKGLLPVYDQMFITMDKQYSTIGINGIVEGAEFLGYEISNNEEYIDFLANLLKVFSETNKEGSEKYGFKFNTELVPAENLGVKNAKWDHEDDFHVKRDCFNSYFYLVEDETLNIFDKFQLHGRKVVTYLDGGSAAHINLQEYPSKDQCFKILCAAIKVGCNYFTFNVKATFCNDCEYINKNTTLTCSKCGSNKIDYATRIIGYLKLIKYFSQPRRIEESKRYHHGKEKI
jgi:ribonucleoside-triphosphate reductase